MKNDGGAAFPGFAFTAGNGSAKRSFPDGDFEEYVPGMSLRDWFAGMALQGLLSNPNVMDMECQTLPVEQVLLFFASLSYIQANAMLEARKTVANA